MLLHSTLDQRSCRPAHWTFAVVVTVLFVVSPRTALAQLSDVKGSKDHPMVSRYAGSIVIGYDHRKFDEIVIPTGPVTKNAKNDIVPTKTQRVEGEVTRILYVAPEGRSSLEVLRNYEQELKKNGFATVYACAAAECGVGDGSVAKYLYSNDKRMSDTPPNSSGRPAGTISEQAFESPRGQRFLVAKRTDPKDGDVYASIYTATSAWDFLKETYNHAIVLLDVVKTVPMETGMVTVDAATMAKDISSSGHVALYGIYFDTDKADLKPESQPTLQEITSLLKKDPSLKLYIVGHTDNVGGFDYNVGLSERRAAAVVKQLAATHGIAAARLKPAGVGMLSPVAPNDREEGRAKNRRVELVKQ